MKKIRKAVIPAAGYGTRFLPATKAMPKEMLPIVDKPVIQYVVEELVSAGIEQIIIVTGWHKRAIEDHFDRHLELEYKLKEAGKFDQLEEIKRISTMAEFVYVRQKEQRGNGDAVLTAKNIVGNEPFVICWGDEFVISEPVSKTRQLIEAYNKYGATVISCLKDERPESTSKYGFAKGVEIEPGVIKVDDWIEKPGIANRPSTFASLGGCLAVPELFEALESIEIKEGQELVYIDGINKLQKSGLPSYAVEIKGGKYYDCGNVVQYLKTNIEMALKRPDISSDLSKFIADLAQNI
ncbi:MAG: UTP--glucose-1-phosphate uridylyltransferase [Candidatus Berkelbacteria bacterium]|nr:UTP--glucose-1-phosphate uridylyltransferase [Candidatus Berkelbacteria bacterium]